MEHMPNDMDSPPDVRVDANQLQGDDLHKCPNPLCLKCEVKRLKKKNEEIEKRLSFIEGFLCL